MPLIKGSSAGQSYLSNGGNLVGANSGSATSPDNLITTRVGKGARGGAVEGGRLLSTNGTRNRDLAKNGIRSPNPVVVSNHVNKNRPNFTLPPTLTKSTSLPSEPLLSRSAPRGANGKGRNGLTTDATTTNNGNSSEAQGKSSNNPSVPQLRQHRQYQQPKLQQSQQEQEKQPQQNQQKREPQLQQQQQKLQQVQEHQQQQQPQRVQPQQPQQPARAIPPPPPPPSTPTNASSASPFTSKRKLRLAREYGKDSILPIDAPEVKAGIPALAPERKFVRAAEKGKDTLLPTTLEVPNNEKGTSMPSSTSGRSSPTRQQRRKHVRAAESGTESLLPEYERSEAKYRSYSSAGSNSVGSGSHSVSMPISRARFGSTPILNGWSSGGGNRSTCSVDSGEYSEDLDMSASITGRSLRRRDRNRLEMLEENYGSADDSYTNSHSSMKMSRRPSFEESPYRSTSVKTHPKYASSSSNQFYLQKFMTMKLGSFLRIVTVVLFLLLVWDANRKASYTSQRLQLFKSEESVVMLHLHRLEKQLLFLHENLERLSGAGSAGEKQAAGNESGGGGNIPAVDVALINKQKQQLFQMEEELNHEVRSLQMQIQKSARRSIVQEYGEGPIQVNVDLQFDRRTPGGGGAVTTSQIGILLWHDTPHAAWTWLEQITTNVWDGATFQLDNSRILAAEPIPFAAGNKNNNGSSRLEFVEQGERGHKAWTVGLMESSSGTLRFFINLQDNSSFSRYYVCIGKVINGFDTLQRLVETSRNVENGGKPVTIVSAKASHLTRRDADSLYK